MNMTLAMELAQTRNQLAEAREEIILLRSAFKPVARPLHDRFGLSAAQEQLLTHLARGGWFSRQQLMTVLGMEYELERNIDAQVKRIKPKIHPVKISAGYGVGYALEGKNLAAIRAILLREERQ